jgi:hypothetical protein
MFRRELLQRYSELRREGNFPGSKLSGFCSGGIRNSAEKGISRGANCQVFAPVVFEIRRAPCVFLYRFAHFPVNMVKVATLLIYLTKKSAKSNTGGAKTALLEILLQEEIQG